jgi:VWFA-related protein
MPDELIVARIILRMVVLAAGLLAASSAQAQDTERTPVPFGAVVEVQRIITEVRVVDYDGTPVLGLGPEDFKVKVGGERAEVRSVLWISSATETFEESAGAPGDEPSTAHPTRGPEGRLIVILFQTDFAMHPSRTIGLVRMAPRASEFVSGLGPNDKVAVLHFESHLELRADFTDDHLAIAEMLNATEVLRGRMDPPTAVGPLLAEHLDAEEAKDAADMARALELIGEALQPIPGTKSLVFFGYALGRMSAGNRVTIDDGYRRAMEALSAAKTSVFSLDITNADYHSLALGLRTIARDTGGFYVKTHLFPETAMKKLVRVISSYYELEIIPPPDLGDEYRIKVSVDRPRTDIYVRQDHPSREKW